MRKFVALIGFLLSIASLHAQDVNCKTIILDNQIQLTDKRVFRSLEQAISEFVNNTKWTSDKIQTNEKIELTIQIIPSKYDQQGNYIEGNAQIICQRPVFGSTYTTNTLNILDEDWKFNYVEFQRMDYNENSFTNNLVALVAFYVNYAIGLDYDSFSLNGGTPYFIEAQSVVTNAQVGGAPGWKSSESGKRNRFYLVDNILQPVFDPMRECLYMYHRKGIDKLYEDKVAGKKAIYDALNKLTPLAATRPNAVNLLSFLFCKIPEFKNVFSDSELKEKQDLVALLKRLDSANSARYQEILD